MKVTNKNTQCTILNWLIFFILNSLPVWSIAQDETALFDRPDSWKNLISKAKAERKIVMLFVDSTSVAGKKMKDSVFVAPAVINRLRESFIAVMLEVDKISKNRWDKEAYDQVGRLNLTSYPAYVFFSSEGETILRSYNYKDDVLFNNLLLLARESEYQDMRKAYNDYQAGLRNYDEMGLAAKAASLLLAERTFAEKITEDYKKNHLNRLKGRELLNKSVLTFILDNGLFTAVKSGDELFKLIYDNQGTVDSLLGVKQSSILIGGVISTYTIEPMLFRHGQPLNLKPDWATILQTLKSRYPLFKEADQLIIDEKISFYRRTENWGLYSQLKDESIRRNNAAAKNNPFYLLNVPAWDIFLNSFDNQALKMALRWSELSIDISKPEETVQYWDTKANLLYKLGKRQKAIATELQAVAIARKYSPPGTQGESFLVKEYLETVEKMKRGLPTWKNTK